MNPLQSLLRAPWRPPLLVALATMLALGASNPGLSDYESFAAERLVEEVGGQLCVQADVPLAARFVLGHCAQVLRQQRASLAAQVRRHTRRTDLGLASLYSSEVGGQRLFGWRVPRARALVLGVAGQFLVLDAAHSDLQAAEPTSPSLAWLRP